MNLTNIPCDRCGQPARSDEDGGRCEQCGDNLCGQCAQWDEDYEFCKDCRNENSTNEPELLPCPFCGGEAEYEIYGDENEYDQVKCKQCGFWFDAPNYDVSSREIWNRRVPSAGQWTKDVPTEKGYYWCFRKSWSQPKPARVFIFGEKWYVDTPNGGARLKEFCKTGLGVTKEQMYWLPMDVPPSPEEKESNE